MFPTTLKYRDSTYKLAGDKRITILIAPDGYTWASGDTYHVRELIKHQGLREWKSLEKAWRGRIPLSNLNHMVDSLRDSGYEVTVEGDPRHVSTAPATMAKKPKIIVIMVKDEFTNGTRVLGDTFQIKEDLKMMGFKWQSIRREWFSKITHPKIVLDYLDEKHLLYEKQVQAWPYGVRPLTPPVEHQEEHKSPVRSVPSKPLKPPVEEKLVQPTRVKDFGPLGPPKVVRLPSLRGRR